MVILTGLTFFERISQFGGMQCRQENRENKLLGEKRKILYSVP